MRSRAGIFLLLFVCVSVAMANGFGHLKDASDLPTPVEGLSWTFYNESCPNLESIVKERVEFYLNQNLYDAGGLLRIHFHDCFVQGCEASVLLEGSTSEQEDTPNLTLSPHALQIINNIKDAVEAICTGIVSCADIVALAARDSVGKVGGPQYSVPLGRRDGLVFANTTVTLANLPSASSNVTGLMDIFSEKGFNYTDLVALSGAHTIGIAYCSSFEGRLYDSAGKRVEDSSLDPSFANILYETCPTSNSSNATNLDIRTPHMFDNKYYADLLYGQAVLTSDQSLYTDNRTRDIVKSFSSNETLFFEHFVLGMLKMGQLNVLTGTEGEIRRNCSHPNPTISVYSADINPRQQYS